MKIKFSTLTLTLTIGLAACSGAPNDIPTAGTIETPATPIGATGSTPLPIYKAGDTYVFNDDGNLVSESVTSVDQGKVHWINDRGDYWTSNANPFLPPQKYVARSGTIKMTREFSKTANDFFPLVVGKRVKYAISQRKAGNGNIENIVGECEVAGQLMVNSRVGTVNSYEVICDTNTGKTTYYYAPEVHHTVLVISEADSAKKTKELFSFVNNSDYKSAKTQTTPPTIATPQAAPPQLKPQAKASTLQPMEAIPDFMISRGTARLFSIQLGAFFSRASAESAWIKYSTALPEGFENARHHLQEHNPPDGGKRLFRLSVGEYSLKNQAIQACRQIKLSGLDCFPVMLK